MIHDRKNSQPKWQIFLTLVLVLCMAGWNNSPAVAAGITYYVDNTNVVCDDGGPGTLATPFCTIGRGATVAFAGDTVRVLAGTYAETVNGNKSGSVGLPITYSAAPGVTVTGDGTATGNAFRMSGESYIVVDGFTITGTTDYGIYTFGSNNITLSNNHVSNSGSPVSGSTRAGIYINSTTNSTISGNITDHNSSHGILLTNGSSNNTISNNVSFANAEQWQRHANGIQVNSATGTNNTVIHNIVYANEDSGLQFYLGANNNIVAGNLSYGNGDHGIDFNAAPNNIVVGNTVQGNVTSGINFEGALAPGSGGATVMNNIMVDNGLRLQVGGGTASGQESNLRFEASSLTGNTLDYNVFYLNSGTVQISWGATDYTTLTAFQSAVPGQETHGVQANPRFMAPAPVAQRPAAAPFYMAVNVGNYHLTAGSPAIDSANSDASNEPTLDLDGNARVDDPATTDSGAGTRTYDDRGAYEYPVAPPTVTTQAVTAIGTTTATGNGNITSLGVPNPTQHGVVWSTLPNPTTANSKTTNGPVSVTGAFTSNITGLSTGTLYHVRAYATNSTGTVYGADVTFTTQTTVAFNANGGTGSMSNQTANYNVATALTANAFTRTGYTFSGWNTAANGSGTAYANGAVYPFTASATLYAQWTINTYTVTFNANGGTGSMSNQTANYNVATALTVNAFTRTGYTFSGWNTAANGSGTAYANGAVYPFTANATLYAQWINGNIFGDVPDGAFAKSFIESVYFAGVTGGCTPPPLNYCPDLVVTRVQMAVFLLRAKHGNTYVPPAATGTMFGDVQAGDFAAAYIEAMANEGITGGCGNGNFCPNTAVTRAQMAVFLLRAKNGNTYVPPGATGAMFTDVPTSGFAAAYIEALATAAITGGCGGGNFCPNVEVTRAQMAVFLVKTFNLP